MIWFLNGLKNVKMLLKKLKTHLGICFLAYSSLGKFLCRGIIEKVAIEISSTLLDGFYEHLTFLVLPFPVFISFGYSFFLIWKAHK